MLLTDQERRRFVEWLEQDVESSKMLLATMKSAGLPAIVPVVGMLEKEMEAEQIVAKKLKSVESQEIRCRGIRPEYNKQ